MIKVLIAEDHHVVRKALAALIAGEDDLTVVGDVADGQFVVPAVTQHAPNILLLDANMPNHDVVATTKKVCADFSETRILILSAYRERVIVQGLLAAGAAGYVLKDDSHEFLLNAIRLVSKGARWISPRVLDVLVSTDPKPIPQAHLTPRETEVLKLMATGARNQQIAEQLNLSHQSVRNYAQRIYRKIDVETRVEAVLYALKNGIASVEK